MAASGAVGRRGRRAAVVPARPVVDAALLAIGLVATVLSAGCGSSPEPPATGTAPTATTVAPQATTAVPAEPTTTTSGGLRAAQVLAAVRGRDLVSTFVRHDGVERPDLIGVLGLRFTPDGRRVVATGGCNSLSAEVTYGDARLKGGSGEVSLRECPKDVAAADALVIGLVRDGSDVSLESKRVVLRTAADEVVFDDRSRVGP